MNVVLALAFAVAAQVAPSPPTPPPPVYVKPIVINYEDDIIEASPHGPNDAVITRKNDVKFKSLIQIRESFERELLHSADQLN